MLTVVPDQHVGRIAVADPVTKSAVAQLDGLGLNAILFRVLLIDLVGWRQNVLHLRRGQPRRGLTEDGISEMQEQGLSFALGAPETRQESIEASERNRCDRRQKVQLLLESQFHCGGQRHGDSYTWTWRESHHASSAPVKGVYGSSCEPRTCDLAELSY